MPREAPDLRELRRRLAANIRRLRVARKLTQEDLAGRVGVGWRHLQKIEAAEINVALSTLQRLGEALEIDPSALIGPQP